MKIIHNETIKVIYDAGSIIPFKTLGVNKSTGMINAHEEKKTSICVKLGV